MRTAQANSRFALRAVDELLERSADFQSAVSPIFNRQPFELPSRGASSSGPGSAPVGFSYLLRSAPTRQGWERVAGGRFRAEGETTTGMHARREFHPGGGGRISSENNAPKPMKSATPAGVEAQGWFSRRSPPLSPGDLRLPSAIPFGMDARPKEGVKTSRAPALARPIRA